MAAAVSRMIARVGLNLATGFGSGNVRQVTQTTLPCRVIKGVGPAPPNHEPMKKENLVSKENPEQQPTISTDSLKKGDTELTEQELGKVSGGRKGNPPVEYIKLTIKEATIS